MFEQLKQQLLAHPKAWLLTGVAGFIGSNLLEALLRLDQQVIGIDNLSTGNTRNLDQVRDRVTLAQWARFRFTEADICDRAACRRAVVGVDAVLHQAALGSVPRSIEHPLVSHDSNVNGFLNLLDAAREAGVKRFVYASSSSVYGDDPGLPKVEQKVGKLLSPYAATKAINEVYAAVYAQCYGMEPIGLRYFNVFGPRQDPEGPYAAVIPKWVDAMLRGDPVYINGDGETSRDFCYVANVVQANLLAAATTNAAAWNEAYNIAVAGRTTLNELYEVIRQGLLPRRPELASAKPLYRDFRAGDVRHSQADITKARKLLGYEPTHTIEQGLAESLEWYVANGTTDL